jgi:hypothetical protein
MLKQELDHPLTTDIRQTDLSATSFLDNNLNRLSQSTSPSPTQLAAASTNTIQL